MAELLRKNLVTSDINGRPVTMEIRQFSQVIDRFCLFNVLMDVDGARLDFYQKDIVQVFDQLRDKLRMPTPLPANVLPGEMGKAITNLLYRERTIQYVGDDLDWRTVYGLWEAMELGCWTYSFQGETYIEASRMFDQFFWEVEPETIDEVSLATYVNGYAPLALIPITNEVADIWLKECDEVLAQIGW